ncbi:tyrosine-type recombinase/integrase [Microbacterium sp. NPDC076911]|uniref:tyrosine-type recombinase/integrase n=1 Tax=Microbacterium sp. NPDC076911 TaxID=3154958 RepID=UPI003434842B
MSKTDVLDTAALACRCVHVRLHPVDTDTPCPRSERSPARTHVRNPRPLSGRFKGSRSWFKTALATAELPLMTIHDLRHTAASLSVQSGANVKAIQRMLGHTSAAMTLDVYSDLFDEDLDAVSAALDGAANAAEVHRLFSRDSGTVT